MKKNSKSGFTLIELLVVISIISLLASILLVTFNNARKKARDAKRLTDIAQIEKALDLYYDANNQYPASGGAIEPNGAWSNSADYNSASSSWVTLQTALAPYVSKLPVDPLENYDVNQWGYNSYHYSYFSLGYGCDRQWYMIVYTSETASGPDPGVTACNGSNFKYGGSGSSTFTKTVGEKAR